MAAGELWATDLFFEFLPHVDIRMRFSDILQLVSARNRAVALRTVKFLREHTHLEIRLSEDSPPQHFDEVRARLWQMFVEQRR